MGLKTKYDILDDVVVRVNNLADARGVDKCALIISVIQNLNELSRLLHEEEENNDSAIKALTEQLDKYKEAEEHEDSDSE